MTIQDASTGCFVAVSLRAHQKEIRRTPFSSLSKRFQNRRYQRYKKFPLCEVSEILKFDEITPAVLSSKAPRVSVLRAVASKMIASTIEILCAVHVLACHLLVMQLATIPLLFVPL